MGVVWKSVFYPGAEATDGDNGPGAREIGKTNFLKKECLFFFAILKFYIRFFGWRRV